MARWRRSRRGLATKGLVAKVKGKLETGVMDYRGGEARVKGLADNGPRQR